MDIDLLKFGALRKRLKTTGELTLRVASDSMEPILKEGQLVVVQERELRQLKRFDIVVFWQQNKLFCHYLWTLQEDLATGEIGFITKSLKSPQDIDLPSKEYYLLGIVPNQIPLYFKIKVLIKNLL